MAWWFGEKPQQPGGGWLHADSANLSAAAAAGLDARRLEGRLGRLVPRRIPARSTCYRYRYYGIGIGTTV